MKCNLPSGPSLVDAHFAGSISQMRERELRSHLPACETCREYYERHLLLSALDPHAKRPQDRLGQGLGVAPAPKPAKVTPFAMALCAAAALLLAIVPLRNNQSGEFLARGSGITTGANDPKLLSYRIEKGHVAKSLDHVMRAADELAFAYANPGAYEKLMVFAVDEHRHIYWYHPEWTSQADDPHAIHIDPGADVREIPAAVSHTFDGTDLTLFAIFSNEDLTVRKVEQMVQRNKSVDDPLPVKGVVKKMHLTVEP
jgi:hypothetical protein